MDGCQSSKSDEYLYGPQLETHRPLMVGASVSLVQNLEAKSPIHASDYPPISGAESPIDKHAADDFPNDAAPLDWIDP
jgi:hypothetical protein